MTTKNCTDIRSGGGDYSTCFGGQVELWSQELKEWNRDEALQDKYLFPTPEAAWEHCKTNVREQNQQKGG